MAGDTCNLSKKYGITLLLMGLFAIFLLIGSLEYKVQAGRLPKLTAIASLILLGCEVYRSFVKGKNINVSKIETNMAFLFITIAYIAVMEYVGFVLTSIIYVYVVMKMVSKNQGQEVSFVSCLLYGVALSVSVYWLFVFVFSISLPKIGFLFI